MKIAIVLYTFYREVIRECPLALDAIKALLQLGVAPREIQVCVSLYVSEQIYLCLTSLSCS